MKDIDQASWTRLAGFAGIVGALGWAIGDILLVGHVADPLKFPLLFQAYADQVDLRMAQALADTPAPRMIAGALLAVFTIPFYLAGTYHLWQGIRGAGRAWVWPALGLTFTGYALAPLAHAAFYFVGAVYQLLPAVETSAQPALLALAAQFRGVLVMVYAPAVAAQALGLLWFSAAAATGRTAYPRWFALTANPLFLGLFTAGLPELFSGALADGLKGAAFNVTWLLVYAQSLWLMRARKVG